MLVPIARRATFEQTYEFAGRVARGLEERHPGLVTTEWLKHKREGVLADHRQNARGKTIASVYSVRPKPGAPVSTPLRWDELTENLTPRRFRDALVRPMPAYFSGPIWDCSGVARRGRLAARQRVVLFPRLPFLVRADYHSQGRASTSRLPACVYSIPSTPRESWMRASYTSSTEFRLATGDIYATQQLLGHADVATTANIYVQARPPTWRTG